MARTRTLVPERTCLISRRHTGCRNSWTAFLPSAIRGSFHSSTTSHRQPRFPRRSFDTKGRRQLHVVQHQRRPSQASAPSGPGCGATTTPISHQSYWLAGQSKPDPPNYDSHNMQYSVTSTSGRSYPVPEGRVGKGNWIDRGEIRSVGDQAAGPTGPRKIAAESPGVQP